MPYTPPLVRPQSAPADPAGGLTADAEARTTIVALIDRLVAAGVLKQ